MTPEQAAAIGMDKDNFAAWQEYHRERQELEID
jgi:hypothetical protein